MLTNVFSLFSAKISSISIRITSLFPPLHRYDILLLNPSKTDRMSFCELLAGDQDLRIGMTCVLKSLRYTPTLERMKLRSIKFVCRAAIVARSRVSIRVETRASIPGISNRQSDSHVASLETPAQTWTAAGEIISSCAQFEKFWKMSRRLAVNQPLKVFRASELLRVIDTIEYSFISRGLLLFGNR